MWTEQVEHFVTELVGRPAVLCGNSLGGFIAVNLASRQPGLVEGLILLNATPFWGTTALSPWAGVYPVPSLLRAVGTRWWNSIRSPDTIRNLLDFVYARPGAAGGYSAELVERILEPTRQPSAASAFCSILFSPPPERSFEHMVHDVQRAGIPVLLAYGREDPWVVPLWGMRLQRQLATQAFYYELTPVGHCPQDEAPQAVAFLVDAFCETLAGQRASMPDTPSIQLGDAKIIFHDKPRPRNVFEILDSGLHYLKTGVLKQPF
jgi:pimeloyl-ACP methyl ester carboxylesterase